MNIPILIPAYQPNEKLLELVDELINIGFLHIIIVNDGSNIECNPIFEKLGKIKECHVMKHIVNLGKGRALKTGLNYIYLNFPETIGLVTADADGQHRPIDIFRIAQTLIDNPNKLVLGVRNFDKKVPIRSLLGNILTKHVFAFLTGKNISDTQTGLRGIPKEFIPLFIKLKGEGYEYEMDMLISTKSHNIQIIEEKIATVYIKNNKSSHFNPFFDSMKIYFLLLRFSFSSLFASFIDFIVFTITYLFSRNIFLSILFARFISGTINFLINKNLVFQNKENIFSPLFKYGVTLIVIGGISYISIEYVNTHFGINVIMAKIIIEILLFLASFEIQRDLVFSRSEV